MTYQNPTEAGIGMKNGHQHPPNLQKKFLDFDNFISVFSDQKFLFSKYFLKFIFLIKLCQNFIFCQKIACHKLRGAAAPPSHPPRTLMIVSVKHRKSFYKRSNVAEIMLKSPKRWEWIKICSQE